MAIELEKYNRGHGRHTCPNCGGRKQFARYIVSETTEPFADHVGICNRASKCGYNYTPKMFYADNPELKTKRAGDFKKQKSFRVAPQKFEPPPKLDFHTAGDLKESLGRDGENPFIQYLFNLFPDCADEIQAVADKYFIGYFNNLTCFWQIDVFGRIRKGKLLRYDPVSGKRQTVYRWTEKNENGADEEVEIKTYWVHRILQKRGRMSADANLKNCFFGEHLLRLEREKIVCVVEAEKTAVLAALCFPQHLWLSVGAQGHLTEERMKVLAGRNVIFYPDADAFELWKRKAEEARTLGINARVSSLIERATTDEEKENGFDLADYLHREQTKINEANRAIDLYNAKVDRITSDPNSLNRFAEICAEREAILEIKHESLSAENIQDIVQNYF